GVTPLKRPAYQRGRRRRTIPDVSFPADAIFPVFLDGTRGALVGGTSAAAPAWAGVVALLNQKRGTRAGLLNPALYALGRAQQAGRGPVSHDITNGSNGFSRPTRGYARARGWGSIDGRAFVTAYRGGP